ncbi:MAG: NUDIX domain-containing protein [Polyangiales bacterium]
MSSAAARAHPTVVDRAFQLAYFCAYRVLRTYWRVRRPTTDGALVAIWSRGEVLLVRNSYVPYYSAPGGYMHRSESPREAAARELREEVGLSIAPERLELALDLTHEWEGKLDHVRIFHLELSERPEVRIDHREVVEARWFAPAQLAGLTVFPPLQRVIAERAAQSASAVQ